MQMDILQNDIMFDVENELQIRDSIFHIRVKQRNGKKCITMLENIEQLNTNNDPQFMKKLLKTMKQQFSCNGVIKLNDSDDLKTKKDDCYVIELQGDQRTKIKDLLINKYSINDENIKVHGF